ncbi:MAG: hypothetical protein H7844_12600 [Nitrospirae bacterium YQR-1]
MELSGIWPMVLPFFAGFLISSNLPASTRTGSLMKALTALPFGFAIVSLLSFLTLIISSKLTYSYAFDGALSLAAAIYLSKRKSSLSGHSISENNSIYYLIPMFIVLSLVTVIFIQNLRLNPHGGWDAWSIWNLRAKFLFKNEAFWKDAFSSHILWSHPDYPLLLPLTVSRWWKYTDGHSVTVAQTTAFIFTFSTLILLFNSISYFKGTIQGGASVLVMAMAFTYLKSGTMQYADIPIGFFFLAASVFIVIKDTSINENKKKFLVLCGLSLGFAAWTKNEGLLFIACFLLARFVTMSLAGKLREFLRELPFIFAAMAPVIVFLIMFKLKIAPPNDIISSVGSETYGKIIDIGRYKTIFKSFLSMCIPYGETNFGFSFLAAIMFLVISGVTPVRKYYIPSVFLLLTVVFILTGYFFVFVVTPHDLNWQLGTALERLFCQVLPLAVFTVFLLSASVAERKIY